MTYFVSLTRRRSSEAATCRRVPVLLHRSPRSATPPLMLRPGRLLAAAEQRWSRSGVLGYRNVRVAADLRDPLQRAVVWG